MKSPPNGFSHGGLVFSGHGVFTEDFPGHLGRPGKQGGSLPRSVTSPLEPGFSDKYFSMYGDTKLTKMRLKRISELPVLKKGLYDKRGSSHDCHDNAKRYAKTLGESLAAGVMLNTKTGDVTVHAWNVKDGKVMEHTDLGLDPDESWEDDYEYRGILVPKSKAKGYKWIDIIYDHLGASKPLIHVK